MPPAITMANLTGIIVVQTNSRYDRPMQSWANSHALSVFPTPEEGYFFDPAGRLFMSWSHGWAAAHGLSGRSVAKRWHRKMREARALSHEERMAIFDRARSICERLPVEQVTAVNAVPRPRLKHWLEQCRGFDREADLKIFRDTYHPVGILPPDQYHSVVLQITEGCAWNQCGFCHFYRRKVFRVKSRSQVSGHIRQVEAFFGQGLSMRTSIFLGEAHALAMPAEGLASCMREASRILVPKMPAFRGYFAFEEPSTTAYRRVADYRRLARAGLRRLYYGLETGQPELRRLLQKPGDVEAIKTSVARAKEAGLWVALIVLCGAGGQAWDAAHTADTVHALEEMNLGANDFVYLSPLLGPDGTGEPALTGQDMESQRRRFQAGLSHRCRVAPYDIREFVY